MKETKENNIKMNVEIEFPSQYMEKYLLGEMDYDAAVDSTIEECHRLIEEYNNIAQQNREQQLNQRVSDFEEKYNKQRENIEFVD